MFSVRIALAVSLFKWEALSLARSARLANMPLADFIAHLSRLGIPVINQTAEETNKDMDTLAQWLTTADTLTDLIAQKKRDKDFDFFAEVNKLAKVPGWRYVLKAAFSVLEQAALEPDWEDAIDVVSFGQTHVKLLPYPVPECIARLYFCCEASPTLDTPDMDNQVWSAVHQWLGLPYTSGWGPYDDPEIVAIMQRMAREAKNISADAAKQYNHCVE